MDSDNIVEVHDVSMMFNLSKERVDNLKEYVIKMLKGKLRFDEFWALKNISFSIKRGESLGILGLNGSGKSTLLKIIAGVLKPTFGRVEVCGSVAPLIELGAGFDYDLTARENVFLNGAILGYSRKMMEENLEGIMDFGELWEFIDVPMKNFSSGMIARLGFAIATISRPDILIADEILSVGDFKFREKCEQRMGEIIANGASVILVSHDIKQVENVCNTAIWIDKGIMRREGNAAEVCEEYSHSI